LNAVLRLYLEAEGNCTTRSSVECALHQIFLDDKIKYGEMSGACSLHEEIRNAYKNWLEILTGGGHSEDEGVNGKIPLKWIL
jgi:hypothetical protein